ncbi:MAG: hypothetical protein MR483_05420 [Bacteroidales bacterium]|nr:hypothetical protein [Bacteroidales bacterium]
MAEGTELGKAYVQIIPSAKGISGKIKEALGDAPAQTGESAGQSLGSRLVSTFKKVIAAAGIGAAISKAVTEGAALEQSIGGVETLFKDSADTIKQYAAVAYKTAGVSANDYMEQVTSFSATLLQGLGGDTAAAAKYANQAIIQMSDNANKMGTEMSAIQYAYQGFAKDHYTMLDNLKLGYGGTQAEMARLINDSGVLGDSVKVTADTVKDVPFNSIIDAIQVIQDNLGLTGTTAKEAATTISGSMASVKAAFSNVLAELTLGQDIQPALNGLADTVTTFFVDNLLPAVWNILSSLPGALTTFAQGLGPQLIGGLINSINQELPGLGTAVGGITATIAGAFAALKALSAGQAIVSGILSIAAAIKTFIAAASFASSPIALLQGAFIAFVNPVGLIVAAVGALTAGFIYLWNTCEPFKQFWIDLGTNITNFVSNAAQAIVNFFTVTLPTGIQNAMTFIQQLPDNISAFFSQIPYMVGNFLGQALGTLASWAVQLPALAKQAASTFLANVVAFFCQLPGNTLKWLTTALTNVAQWAVQLGKKGTEAAKALLNNVVNGLMQLPGKLLDIGRQAVEGLWNGIKAAAGWLQDQIGSFVSGIVDGFTSAFKIGSPSRIMRDKVGRWITPGIAEGITGSMGCLKSAMTDVRDLVTGQMAGLQTGVSTALSVDPAWAVPTVSPQSSGSVQPVTLDELADLVALIIQSIRENGGPIIIGDEVIGRANDRYRQNRAIMTGGMA